MAVDHNNPQSRDEEILIATIDGTEYDKIPQSRIEELLLELKEVIEEGGGGGGTTVVANPDGEATDYLIKVKIGSTIYEIEGGSGSAVLAADLTVTKAVGGLTVGTTYQAGTSIEELLHDMLDPIVYPTLINPSVTLAGSGSKLLETGATLSATLTATFNRGSINPAYGTSGYRSGPATGYTLNGGTEQEENTWSETVSSANRTFQCVAAYSAGEQPKDSAGRNYSTPLAAGSVTSGTVTYDFVDAMWANTANITTIAKLSLIAKSTKQRDMNFPAQTVANPEVFDIPASWTVTAVQVKNDLSGAWEDASSQFTVTNVNHDNAGSVSTAYKRYTFNMGTDTGARSIRVKWS